MTATDQNHNKKMTDFNYKKYSLDNLENWLHDALSGAEASPKEIYDCIYKVASENYYYHKHNASQAYELMTLLSSNPFKTPISSSTVDSISSEDYSYDVYNYSSEGKWTNFFNDDKIKFNTDPAGNEVETKTWTVEVEQNSMTGECFIEIPVELLNSVKWKEGDIIKWVDNHNGSFSLIKED